jgi:beta-1,4-mannosyltransferase
MHELMREPSKLEAADRLMRHMSGRRSLDVLAWPAFRSENPYTSLLYRELEELGVPVAEFSASRLLTSAPAILHLHWPEMSVNVPALSRAFVRGTALLLLIGLARLRGTKVVWTVHNLHSHEGRHPRLERWFWRMFIPLVTGYISLSPGGGEAARHRFRTLRRRLGFVIPHGHFRSAYPASVSAQQARASLHLPVHAPVYAFVGQIRSYKNVPNLIRIFRELTNCNARLLVAGKPESLLIREQVLEAAAGDDRVVLRLGHIPDEMVQVYLRACDLVVLPFTEVLNSGSALLALGFDRPVLVPLIGAMGELQSMAEDWVQTYDGSLSASELERAMLWAQSRAPGRCEALDHLDWAILAGRTLEAYQTVRTGA